MLKRMISKWFSSDETDDITDKEFGSVVKFRVGSTVSISPAFTVLISENLLFGKFFEDLDLSDMIVDTILSFQMSGINIYRLYCSCIGNNVRTMVQVQEEQNGTASFMVFLLTQETALQNEDEYNEWYANSDSIMRSGSINHEHDDEPYEFNKVFGPVEYSEVVEADGTAMERPPTTAKAMSLFDRQTDDGVEYMLFDAELNDWFVEGFSGLDVPSQEVTIK